MDYLKRIEVELVEQSIYEFMLVRQMNNSALKLTKTEAAKLLKKEILDIAQSKLEPNTLHLKPNT